MRSDLDEFDLQILQIVSADSAQTHAKIGERVKLSASAVRRRLLRLRRDGVITREVAIIDPDALGMSFIVHVWTNIDATQKDHDLKAMFSKDDAISQCYSVSGECDYVLIVHATSPHAYETWSENTLLGHPHITRFTSTLVWSRTKFSPSVAPAEDEGHFLKRTS